MNSISSKKLSTVAVQRNKWNREVIDFWNAMKFAELTGGTTIGVLESYRRKVFKCLQLKEYRKANILTAEFLWKLSGH